jgi:hypothetical protein
MAEDDDGDAGTRSFSVVFQSKGEGKEGEMLEQLTPITLGMSVFPGDKGEHGTIGIALFVFI